MITIEQYMTGVWSPYNGDNPDFIRRQQRIDENQREIDSNLRKLKSPKSLMLVKKIKH